MDTEKLLESLSEKYDEPIPWHTYSSYYADSTGIVCDSGAIIFNQGTIFHICTGTTDESFESMEVLTIEHARKSAVLDFISGKAEKLHRIGALPSLFTDSLDVVELDSGKLFFLKLKGTEFRQMLKIASGKQKYSLTEYNKAKAEGRIRD